MKPRTLTRRRLLTGAAGLAAPLILGRRAAAQGGVTLRIGAILPLGGSAMPTAPANVGVAAEAARMGLLSSEEDLLHNAGLFGGSVTLLTANAPGPEAAARAARRLVAVDGAEVLIGGFADAEAQAISGVATETDTLFLNICATGDHLRGGACGPRTFHVAASAAMQCDAIAGWFVRAGFRRWHLVTDANAALTERMRAALQDRHWGARIVGESRLDAARGDYGPAVADIADSAPDVVLCLTDWFAQLGFLARYEAAELAPAVTGFPDAMAQTRHFYALARRAAPAAGTGHRAAQWEATLDAYGARELNARFAERWGVPMDAPAWAAYQSMKIAYEAARRAGSTEGGALASVLTDRDVVFDVHKGIGVGFRPWDHQLRQSLYLVKINATAALPGSGVAPLFDRASLVGELPAIYMPGTDPVERLDQLGDVSGRTSC